MTEVNALETPAAIVDLDRLTANLDRAAAYATSHGLSLRPHSKTHKSPWIAAKQRKRGPVEVTCATPREAMGELNARLGQSLAALRDAGVSPRAVSGGSTPTLWDTHTIEGVTEFRPGTYVFNDRTTAEIGACDWSDCAFTVLATVIST